jgi:hypothetical protein
MNLRKIVGFLNCDLYNPNRITSRTYEKNFLGSMMDKTEN